MEPTGGCWSGSPAEQRRGSSLPKTFTAPITSGCIFRRVIVPEVIIPSIVYPISCVFPCAVPHPIGVPFRPPDTPCCIGLGFSAGNAAGRPASHCIGGFRDNYSASMTATTRIEPDEKVPTASGDLMKSGYGVTNTVTATVSTSAQL